MSSNHLIFFHPLLLPPPLFPSIRVFSSKSVCIRWPKYWRFSFSISPSNEYSGPLGGLTGLISLQSKGLLAWARCMILEYFLPFCTLSFHFLQLSFEAQNLLISMKSIISFFTCALLLYLRIHYVTKDNENLLLCLVIFTVSSLTFKFLSILN